MNYFRHDCDCGSCEPQGNWQYIFKGPPEKIVLFATAHKQKGKEIFLGSSTALTLDMLSSVPAIPERNQYETVSEILRTRSEQHWQRALDNFPQVEPRNDRMQRIGEFWELPTSWVVNPVVVSEDERTGIVEITPMAEPNPDGSQQMSIEIGDWTYSGICPFCGQNFNDWVQILN